MGRFKACLAAIVLAASVPISASAQNKPISSLRVSAFYTKSDSGWPTTLHPTVVQAPTSAELTQVAPALSKADFGVSFACGAKSDGALVDCQPVFGLPANLDARALTQVLGRMIRIDQAAVATARAKGYRITINAVLAPSPPPPQPDHPVLAWSGDPPPPPPPPPEPEGALAVFAVDHAQQCYDSAWEPMADAMNAAGRALRNPSVSTSSEAYRRLALDFVKRRQALAFCIAELQETSSKAPLSPKDIDVVQTRLSRLISGYRVLDRRTITILGGLLDRYTGEREESFAF